MVGFNNGSLFRVENEERIMRMREQILVAQGLSVSLQFRLFAFGDIMHRNQSSRPALIFNQCACHFHPQGGPVFVQATHFIRGNRPATRQTLLMDFGHAFMFIRMDESEIIQANNIFNGLSPDIGNGRIDIGVFGILHNHDTLANLLHNRLIEFLTFSQFLLNVFSGPDLSEGNAIGHQQLHQRQGSGANSF